MEKAKASASPREGCLPNPKAKLQSPVPPPRSGFVQRCAAAKAGALDLFSS